MIHNTKGVVRGQHPTGWDKNLLYVLFVSP